MSQAIIAKRTDAEITALANAEDAARVYDSGWFAVAVDTIYTKTHGLGSNKLLITVFASENSNGSDCHKLYQSFHTSSSAYCGGCFIDDVQSNTLEVKVGENSPMGQNYYPNDDGHVWGNEVKYATRPTSGYYRVLARLL